MRRPLKDSPRRDDLAFCWDKALESDSWFRLHFAFAPRAVAQPILALHALFAMLERSSAMSEESLVSAHLAWWHAELSLQSAAASAHPVVRTLRESNALDNLSVSLREALVAQAFEIARRSRPGSWGDLRTVCGHVGGARVLSELSLALPGLALEVPSDRFAGTGLCRILELSLRSGTGLWFVPLELQAKHRAGSGAVERSTPEGRALVDALANVAEGWFDDQIETVQRIIPAPALSCGTTRHLFASMASQRLQLKRTFENLREGRGAETGGWGVTDLIKVWRECRRHSKQSE